jgi:RNA polymerase sigma-70 factor (ECF subfamily)
VRRGVCRGEQGGIAKVAPVCPLIREAISAALDGERSPVEALDVERHLAHCTTCRRFGRGAASLLEATRGAAPLPAPSPDALARVSGACRRNGKDAAAARLAGRLCALLRGRAVPWPALAMGVSVALPSVSLAALAHFHGAYAAVHSPCAVLLHRALKQ